MAAPEPLDGIAPAPRSAATALELFARAAGAGLVAADFAVERERLHFAVGKSSPPSPMAPKQSNAVHEAVDSIVDDDALILIAPRSALPNGPQRAHAASNVYSVGGGVTGFRNGLAIAGDFMSAANRPYQGCCGRRALSGHLG